MRKVFDCSKQGARGPASPAQPEPMQIDRTRLSPAERKRRLDSNACLYCGHQGNFHTTSVLVDSGAEESFIDATLATKWGVPVSTLQTSLTASALNGSRFACVKHLTVAELEFSAPSVQAFIRLCRATWRRTRTSLLHSGAQLPDDSEARVQLAEKRSRELTDKVVDLMEQRNCMEKQRARHLKDLDRLNETMKTVEDLLKTGLIEVADKEKELQAVRAENQVLKRDVEILRQLASEQTMLESTVEDLKSQIQQKDEEVSAMDERLQAALCCSTESEQTIAALERQLDGLQAETAQLRQRELLGEQSSADASAQRVELQAQLCSKDAALQALRSELEAGTSEVNQRTMELTAERSTSQRLDRENKDLRVQLERETSRCQQLGTANAELADRVAPMQDLERNHQRLERSHQRLAELRRRAQEAGSADPGQAEEYRSGGQTRQTRRPTRLRGPVSQSSQEETSEEGDRNPR
ncbi:unnamed protein product [Lota lota]